MKNILTISTLVAALLLTACGTDGDAPSSHNPKPVTAHADLSEGAPYTNLDLSREIEGCEWEISIHLASVSPAAFEDGAGRSLPYAYEVGSGRLYKLTEGAITRWAQVGDGFTRIGLSCLREEQFR